MFIARYPFFLLLIMTVLLLSACGNALVQERSAIGHERKSPEVTAEVPGRSAILDLNQSSDIDTLMPALIKNRVVYIGETHDNFSHHNAQLEIITAFHAAGAELGIGMEMFQRPFQPYLDQYIAGDITESEMLRKTEWYERWVYDYRHYRPILNFAKEHQLPVIALNTSREITSQVSKQGIESLSGEQRSQIPTDMDYSDKAYGERLNGIFKQHGDRADRSFERFLQVQLLWDEGMAQRAADFLVNYPEKQLIVLAGSGHLMHGSGIPNRVKRRLPISSAIVLPGDNLNVEPAIADYIIFPPDIMLPKAGLMGIFMAQSSDGVRVSELSKAGAAEKSGIQPDDILLAIDGQKVANTTDVRIGLLNKHPGDQITLDILRKGVLFGSKRISLQLVLGE
ncbi:MAG: ChaN family lipoprotein [Sedimenticola sp.]|nr:ChaN family lipoprotein [Sedimenticola sp.]